MRGWLPGCFDRARTVEWVWAGWGSALAEGPGGRLSCTGVRGGWFVWCWHERHARCCPVGWWWVPPRALVCGGGMLSGFWGSAPWLPGPCSAALCGWWGVGVGGLVVNCIVDASILL